jgi:hypothetical protein
MSLLQYTYEQFIADHEGQLRHFHVPSSLYAAVHAKLTGEVFDAGGAFMFAQESESAPLRVYSSRAIGALSDVFLIDHAWTFRSKTIARVPTAVVCDCTHVLRPDV